MHTAKILTTSFLAAALAGCGSQESWPYICHRGDKSASVTLDGESVTVTLRKDEIVSEVPYAEAAVEVWTETAPRREAEYQKSVADNYCRSGAVPTPEAPL